MYINKPQVGQLTTERLGGPYIVLAGPLEDHWLS